MLTTSNVALSITNERQHASGLFTHPTRSIRIDFNPRRLDYGRRPVGRNPASRTAPFLQDSRRFPFQDPSTSFNPAHPIPPVPQLRLKDSFIFPGCSRIPRPFWTPSARQSFSISIQSIIRNRRNATRIKTAPIQYVPARQSHPKPDAKRQIHYRSPSALITIDCAIVIGY